MTRGYRRPALHRAAGYHRRKGVVGGVIAVAAPAAPGERRVDPVALTVVPGVPESVRLGMLPIR